MTTPRIEIDLGKITQNARYLSDRLGASGISVSGVTKAVGGHPGVAMAMLDGGIADLVDARIGNILRMRKAGIRCPISLIRAPLWRDLEDVIRCCNASYNTEIETIRKLGSAARARGVVHDVILLVEMGDMRDGILPENLGGVASLVCALPGVALKGVAANFACLGHVAPTASDMAILSRLVDQVEADCGLSLALVSGGSSANLAWALGSARTGWINNLRLGEAILLGTDPVSGKLIDGLQPDAFALFAEVIETQRKPGSQRPGPGDMVPRDDRGNRSVLAVGQQDTDTSGLKLPAGVGFVGATSDHMVVHTARSVLAVGSEIRMGLTYGALMRAMNSPDVAKVVGYAQPIRGLEPENGADPQMGFV